MKKTPRLITFFIASLTAIKVLAISLDGDEATQMAYWDKMDDLFIQTRQKALTDDNALIKLIRMSYDISFGSFSSGILIEDMRVRAEKSSEYDEIPLKREINVMESMVREGLIVMKKGEKNQEEEFHQAYLDIDCCVMMLAAIPNYDVMPLLKECLKFNHEGVRFSTLRGYVQAKNVATIPFLHELIVEANLTNKNRSYIYNELERSVELLKRNEKNDDVTKINMFLKEVREAKKIDNDMDKTKEKTQSVLNPDLEP